MDNLTIFAVTVTVCWFWTIVGVFGKLMRD